MPALAGTAKAGGVTGFLYIYNVEKDSYIIIM